ncbi:MAG TPA: glycosyltransferase family 2 protein [Bacteroidota bacterium]|nr:glycosyltransferase family 2 protein [Bacteroidota bacterium]
MTNIGAVVVNWNTADHLHRCIDSLLTEGIALKDVVVVDQGSTDQSVQRIRRSFPGLKVLIHKNNEGYGRAVNIAMKCTQNPLVVVANADAFVQLGSVGALSDVCAADERIALAGPRLCDVAGKNVTRFSMTSILRALLLEIIPFSLRGVWRDMEAKLYQKEKPFDVTYVEGACMLVRRSSFEDIGGFDEGFTFFSEDADLCVRMVKSGFRVVHVPQAAVIHQGGASFSQAPLRHAIEFNKNMIRFYERHALRRSVWLRRGLLGVLKVKLYALKLVARVPVDGDPRPSVTRRLEVVRAKHDSLINNNKMSFDLPSRKALVSVIIPTYNRRECLIRLLDCLRDQTYKKYEVIIVDQSEAISREKQSAYKKFGKKLRVLRIGIANRSVAKNVGFRESSGGLVLFCDDDIVPPDNFIETHVDRHRQSDLAGVSCRYTEPGLAYTQSQSICRVTFYGRLLAGFQSDTTCNVQTLAGPNMSVKRELAGEAGYFDRLLIGTSIFEEQDFSARLLRDNHKILFTNDISFPHNPQQNGNISAKVTDPVQYYHDFHHNEIVYFLKNRNHFCLPFVVPFCMLRTIKQTYLRGLSFRDSVHILSGVIHGFQSYYRSLR